jgi:protein-L-isoaspartate(D-aspartate) O-methyltransferase
MKLFLFTAALIFATASTMFFSKPISNNNYILSEQKEKSAFAANDTVEWEKPRFSERKEERHRMVETGIKDRGVTDPKTLEAMRHVPRHLFVPESRRDDAYLNRPLPIGHGQTISQPYIVGYMTEMLDLEAGEKVLEVGTGSGYQAAVLSEITPHVYTIEIVEELGKQAKKRFDSLGYSTIKTKIGDGYNGWPKHAPFDAIILTAAADEIPQPLVDQLKKGGKMILPVEESGLTQKLAVVTKTEDGEIKVERKLPVRFVPMTGKDQKN